MRTVPAAMAWEFWRQGRLLIIGTVVGLVGITSGGHMCLTLAFGTAAAEQYLATGGRFMSLSELHCCVGSILLVLLRCYRKGLFTLPVTSRALVAWRMLPAVTAFVLMYLAICGLNNALAGLRSPLVDPLLYGCVLIFCGIAAIAWSMDFRFWKPLAMATCGVGYFVWVNVRFLPDVAADASSLWPVFVWYEWLVMAAAVPPALVVLTRSVRRQRQGECRAWPDVGQWLDEAMGHVVPRGNSLRSPAAAQFWFEWRQKGIVLPVVGGSLTAFVLLAWAMFLRDPPVGRSDAGPAAPLLLIQVLLAAMVGLFAGHQGSSARMQMSTFRGTRPATNRQLGRALAKTVFFSTVLNWLICVGLIFLVVGPSRLAAAISVEDVSLLQQMDSVPAIDGSKIVACLVVGTLVMSWAGMGLGSSIALTGRAWLIGVIVFSLEAAFVLWLVAMKWLIPADWWEPFQAATAYMLGAMLLLGTIWAFTVARRRRLVASGSLSLCAAAWLAAIAYAAVRTYPLATPMVPYAALAAGLVAFPLLPLATMPLALAWNRHR